MLCIAEGHLTYMYVLQLQCHSNVRHHNSTMLQWVLPLKMAMDEMHYIITIQQLKAAHSDMLLLHTPLREYTQKLVLYDRCYVEFFAKK